MTDIMTSQNIVLSFWDTLYCDHLFYSHVLVIKHGFESVIGFIEGL
jgi:hypothetical protein